MTIRAQKRALLAVAAALFVAAGGVLLWGFSPSSWPKIESSSTPVRHARLVSASNSAATTVPALASFEAIWDRPLRRPLYDPPPPVPPPVEKKPLPPLKAKLLATIIEPEGSQAMLELPNGAVVFRRVGEIVGPENPESQLTDIQAGLVIVKRGTDESRLTIE